jgi:hypothetical protein
MGMGMGDGGVRLLTEARARFGQPKTDSGYFLVPLVIYNSSKRLQWTQFHYAR